MRFSTQQMKTTHNILSQAEEATIQSIFAVLQLEQLKKIMRTVERSIKNRNPAYNCRCQNCGIHSVNMEDGTEVCDSCLAE